MKYQGLWIVDLSVAIYFIGRYLESETYNVVWTSTTLEQIDPSPVIYKSHLQQSFAAGIYSSG